MTADCQLIQQRRRHIRTSCRDHYGVVGCMFWPAQRAIAMLNMDIAKTFVLQSFSGLASQFFVTFNRVRFSGDSRQDCRSVARSGSDFEYSMRGFEFEGLYHQCNNIWLRNRLSLFDREPYRDKPGPPCRATQMPRGALRQTRLERPDRKYPGLSDHSRLVDDVAQKDSSYGCHAA